MQWTVAPCTLPGQQSAPGLTSRPCTTGQAQGMVTSHTQTTTACETKAGQTHPGHSTALQVVNRGPQVQMDSIGHHWATLQLLIGTTPRMSTAARLCPTLAQHLPWWQQRTPRFHPSHRGRRQKRQRCATQQRHRHGHRHRQQHWCQHHRRGQAAWPHGSTQATPARDFAAAVQAAATTQHRTPPGRVVQQQQK